jgi:hypothetical protein
MRKKLALLFGLLLSSQSGFCLIDYTPEDEEYWTAISFPNPDPDFLYDSESTENTELKNTPSE